MRFIRKHTAKKYVFSGKKQDITDVNIKTTTLEQVYSVDAVLSINVSIPLKQQLLETTEQLSKPLRDLSKV
jgi:hypothetical protein